MAIDPIAAAGLVAREVRTGERNGSPTRVVVARRSYPTDQADLWDVLTNPERIPRWFLPVDGDLEVAGGYQLEGSAGGIIEACVEPESFSLTWVFGGSTSWLAVLLSPDDKGTMLELVHEAPDDKAFWKRYGPAATGIGWELAFIALDHHCATGDPYGPVDEEAFCASVDGAAFLEAAAAGWAEAAIVDGDNPAEARAAGVASTAFYTPQPD